MTKHGQTSRRELLAGGVALAGMAAAGPAMAQAAEVSFFYPVAVGGPITKLIDSYAADFEKENPNIKVRPIYAGTYQETIVKALTAHKSGTPPVTSLLLSTDMFTLIDEDVVEPVGAFVKNDADKAWLAGFMPAYLKSAQVGGKLWSIPFQRSTAVLYYNKDAFASAGLDPNKPPKTWAEMVAMGKAVTQKDASGKVTRWGVGIPGNIGSSQWLFGALVALPLGSGIGWVVIVRLFGFDWLPDWGVVLAVLGAGLALVNGFALAASLPLLRARPASVLREL